MLDNSDKVWATVRHQHFGHASRHIASAVSELQDKEKRVNAQGAGGVKNMETSQIRRMLQTLPQYQYVGVKVLTLHRVALTAPHCERSPLVIIINGVSCFSGCST